LAYSLLPGKNTIAIQVHHYPHDTIVSAQFAAFIGSMSTEVNHQPLPDGFILPPTYASASDLPIFYIDTDGQSIDSLTKITAHMGVVYSALTEENVFGAPFNHYDGQISIKYRGQSSLEFPKKSFTIETQTATGENLNVPLLGLPIENDWVLYAPYSDKTLIRNAFAYKTFESMGHYAPRTRFVELILNGYYQGVYLLVEKIKRDNNRVDIAKLEPHEVYGDDLTGGYLLRNDKGGELGVDSWRGSTDLSGTGFRQTVFQLDYPDPTDVATEQFAYIQQFCDSMETALLTLKYTGDKPDYIKYIDLDSWVDKFILTELCKDVDSYRYSEYMYKQKNSNGGKLVMGPVWDYNTGFGNLNYGSGEFWLTEDWAMGNSSNQIFWA